MTMNKISIITVCYNAGKVIRPTIKSILEQTYSNIEYIIVDGGSKDNTLSVVRESIKEFDNFNVVIISEPDNGIYDAMNKGIKIASGKWIIFMNAGDTFFNCNVIKNIVLFFQDDFAVIYGDIAIFKKDNYYREISSEPFKHHLLMGFNHQGSFIRNDIAKKYLFNTSFILGADYDMMLRIYRDGLLFKYVPSIIAIYDVTGVSVQHNKRHYKDRLLSTYGQTSKAKILYYKYCLLINIRAFARFFFPYLTAKYEEKRFMKNKEIIKVNV